jgi:hypothetical protein
VQPGQRVAGEDPEDDGAQDHPTGEDAGVHQRLRQVDPAVDRGVVVEGPAADREGSGQRGVGLLLQGADEHVVEGEQEQHGTQHEHDHAGDSPEPASARGGWVDVLRLVREWRGSGRQYLGHVSPSPAASD